jgi:hypothetical protein
MSTSGTILKAHRKGGKFYFQASLNSYVVNAEWAVHKVEGSCSYTNTLPSFNHGTMAGQYLQFEMSSFSSGVPGAGKKVLLRIGGVTVDCATVTGL